MLVELHILQNFAPSNLNRDDANAPKDCMFGGYRRARISSQCIKRSVRNHPSFKERVQRAGGDVGMRTKRIIGKIADLLREQHGKDVEKAQSVAERAIALFGIKRDDKRPEKTSILLYLGENELSEIAGIALRHWDALLSAEVAIEDEKTGVEDGAGKGKKKTLAKAKLTEAQKVIQKELHKIVGEERLSAASYAADIALFGRMVADKNVKNMNVVAACQVAHAISTNKVDMETDYFTAVDDLLPDEETGSDMIGVVEFNSSCFYRYSVIDVDKLRKNLGKDEGQLLAASVSGYLAASIKAVPTGKQNGMAAQNPPGYVRILVRKDGFPWSLANAFQKPVFPSEGKALEERSIEVLESYLERLKGIYGSEGIVSDEAFNIYQRDPSDPSGGSLASVVEKTASALGVTVDV